jgi:hypothetical protein
MRKIRNIVLLLFLSNLLFAQNQLINNGAIIKVENGANLRVDNGGILNQSSGTIDNQGNIYLDETYNQITSATYSGGLNSWLWFEGTANQNMTGDALLNIARLRVDNGNLLILGNDVQSRDVDLMTNSNIQLGTSDLVVVSGGSIVNYDAANYIITNSTGYLQQEVAGTAVVFPIGNSIYNPATLSNTGTTDNFQARVEDQVLDEYPLGTVEIDGVVAKAWFIDEQTIGGSDVTMTLQWDTGDELPNFNRAASGISRWSGTNWDRSPTWTAATSVGGTSWTQTRAGITAFSPFAIEDLEMDLPVELMAFNANRTSNDQVLLDWQTASELNNQGFYIERMLENETEFVAIGWIDGFGTTSEITHYEYNDDNAYTGVSYYRLRQVDFDGTESLSEVRAVNGSDLNVFSDVSIYPVPVRDELTISFGKLPKGVNSGQVRIVDMQGRVIYEASVALASHQTLLIEEVQAWASGMYLLQIQLDNGSSMLEKFVKE